MRCTCDRLKFLCSTVLCSTVFNMLKKYIILVIVLSNITV